MPNRPTSAADGSSSVASGAWAASTISTCELPRPHAITRNTCTLSDFRARTCHRYCLSMAAIDSSISVQEELARSGVRPSQGPPGCGMDTWIHLDTCTYVVLRTRIQWIPQYCTYYCIAHTAQEAVLHIRNTVLHSHWHCLHSGFKRFHKHV